MSSVTSLHNAPAAIFDLDGTLTDPKSGITESVRYALKRLNEIHGLNIAIPTQDELQWVIGPPLVDSFRLLAGVDYADAGVALYRERYAPVGLYENAVYPGIPEALAELKRQGYRLYVGTSKPRVFAQKICDHFDLTKYFDVIHGSELDGRNIHKPDLLRFVVAQEGIDPARAVMIGDRKHDAIGAKAVGIPTIGVDWGYGSREELEKAGVAMVLSQRDEIVPAVNRLVPLPVAVA